MSIIAICDVYIAEYLLVAKLWVVILCPAFVS